MTPSAIANLQASAAISFAGTNFFGWGVEKYFVAIAVRHYQMRFGQILFPLGSAHITGQNMAAGSLKPARKASKGPTQPRNLKRKRDDEDITVLQQHVDDFEIGDEPPETFADLPLSSATHSGLKASSFITLTPIQLQAVPSGLRGNDILGAARTGSGKTLAFLIPVLENLFRRKWTEYDGLGALILSPTRELAIQIFEVLRKIGRNHTFSAGLVIGGKSLQEERERLGRMNILVATPGRMLQHLDQTADFDVGNLQILVLDEADRIMDMGFKDTVDAIIDHLPPAGQRQTLLFSATQTKRVSDLARLSLKDPQFVAVNEAGQNGEAATPEKLQQNYVLTPLPEKLDVLWSFIRSNLKAKTLVFLSSGKQVRFVYEAFRHLQPGIPLMHLHGRQKQTARLDITTKFSKTQTAVLFSTDVAARGLDFPAVDWVVQVDCPEDVDTYIHRAGRTARYHRDGRAVLFLDPSEEEAMLSALAVKKINLEKINVRQKKQTSIETQLQNMCFKDPELKYLGQKAFISYVRSIHIQKNKDIFNVKNLALDEYASSLGLPGAPKIKFVKGDDAKAKKNKSRQLAGISDSEEENPRNAKARVRTKYDRIFERQNQDVLAQHYTKVIDDNDTTKQNGGPENSDDDDNFLSIKRRFTAGDAQLGADESADETENARRPHNGLHNGNGSLGATGTQSKQIQLSDKPDDILPIDSKRREKLLKSKKALLKFKGHGSHMKFDDEGVGHEAEYYEREEEFGKKGPAAEQRNKFLNDEREWIAGIDQTDKELARSKRKEKRIRRKEREKLEAQGGDRTAVLGSDADEIGIDLDTLDYGNNLADPSQSKSSKQQQPKKWFQDQSSGDEEPSMSRGKLKDQRAKRRRIESAQKEDDDRRAGPQTVEDLEAMALGVLQR